jgi:23S rRNA (guanosine2251-2'-O)-methyltransferase
MSEEQTILEGHLSVAAALVGRSRAVHAIYIRQDRTDQETARLQRLARGSGVPLQRLPPERIEELASGGTHGGVIAVVGPRRFQEVEALLPRDPGKAPFLAMLDGVEDPFNFGQCIRALYAAGADGLIIPPRNWMTAAAVVGRASAGTSELMPTAVATAAEAAELLRAHGLLVACSASHSGAVNLFQADLRRPLFLVIGGERRGVTRSFLDQADLILRIPYGRQLDISLGTTAATAVLAFEVMRQRQQALTSAG